ncbi:MAG: glycosyltransferase family 4 protein [Bacteroidetes bacterium]|nr:glycosyltransferase family 4 protein [Bacteroidota bacterium]
MKRVLIITYYWPPSGGAGVQRWLKFVKYLRRFNWEPVIYTPENPEFPETDHSLAKDVPENLEVIKQPIWEPYDTYKKLLGRKKEEKINAAFLSEKKKNSILENLSVWIRGNFFIPDARKFWIRPSIKFLLNYLEKNPVSAVISTGPPHSMHLIAMEISNRMNLSWLADFRDPWTNIDFYKDLKLTARADAFHKKLEKQVLSRADVVTVISRSMAEDCRNLYERRYEVITNGYDAQDTDHGDPAEIDKKFSIAHIGTLVSTRNPETLWIALQELIAENPAFAGDLEIKLVGKVDYKVMEAIEQRGLTSFVRKIDYMPHDKVVKCQQQSRVLLLIINNTPNAKMILTGKFFEYLAARRPILCLGPADGDAAAILFETNAGLLAGFGDAGTMKNNIRYLYNKYLDGLLISESHNIEQYSRLELTGKIAALLDRLAG